MLTVNLQEFGQTSSIDGKEVCLKALGQVPTPELAQDFIDFVFSDNVAKQDVLSALISFATNAKVRDVLWQYVTKEWKTVSAKLSANAMIMDRFVKYTLSHFATPGMDKEVEEFFKDKDTTGWDRGVSQAIDAVRTNAWYRERDEKLVLEWLQAHGYA